MKDRVPLYPGRVTLTPVSGQANTYDMVRADQPTEEGTPLNKENLLSDETAAALGLSGDPTVDDAFGALDQSIKDQTKVGDIKITTRTDLGDKWLLCNGERLSDESYSDLTQTLQNPPKSMDVNAFSGSSIGTYGLYITGPVSNGNGVFVFVECNSGNIIYSKDYGKSWTVKSISGIPSNASSSGVNAGVFANGNYVFACATESGSLIIFYAEDPEENFNFSTVSTSVNTTTNVQGIAYGNGYWCILTKITSNNTIEVFTSTSLSGPWTKHSQIGPSPNVRTTRLIFEDGKFSFASTGNGTYAPSIFYAENPSGSWTQKVLENYSSAVYARGYGKVNGYYYAYFQNRGIYYSESIDDDFERVSLSNTEITYSGSENFPFFIESDGTRYYSTYTENSSSTLYDTLILCESLNIFGPYTDITVAKLSSPKYRECARNLIYINGTWCALFSETFSNSNFSITMGIGGILPNIPVENAYAYIKAKE